jgi:S1-C subfamily serine protease
VVVVRVTRGGPAAQAGIKAATHPVTVNGATAPLGGDAIVAVDGSPIQSSTQLADAISSRKPGDRVRLETVRGGSTRQVDVVLGSPR